MFEAIFFCYKFILIFHHKVLKTLQEQQKKILHLLKNFPKKNKLAYKFLELILVKIVIMIAIHALWAN